MYRILFSKKALESGHGTTIWADKNGLELEGTGAIRTDERVDWRKVYTWNDAVEVGIAVKLLRKGAEAQLA